ncbi:hypothetical protein GUITHDRAFT_146877 [Guillardia theta CCMP2712]|uniref:Uncharacterized protein n=1 Tax=Guillardia theta (strain CCMP2712) TaxID=905079 RepID=L1IF43_GUITC|nr:hypothetical protein GUITHDRAFT_146877 [Guillardia theta CCMP2712]EKX34866.1 hypothetical protein GUITHDRAFT_146877 [Guillardia theta CCMP2712]|eukprot:XP_005821846.1 hypothetical protein GUITHDRAFT_146877 [Guillardia theta CCMP2712]
MSLFSLIVKSIVFASCTLVSLYSTNERHITLDQQVTNSSVCVLLGCTYFLAIKVVSLVIARMTNRDRDPNYNEVEPAEDRELEEAIRDLERQENEETDQNEEETRRKHQETMRKAQEFTLDLDGTRDNESTARSFRSSVALPLRAKKEETVTEFQEIMEVYRVVYFIGLSIFVASYTVDMTNGLSGMSLITGIIITQVPETISFMRHRNPEPHVAVNRCFSLFSFICVVAAILAFALNACANHTAPDDLVLCTRIENPRVDVLFGIALPLGATLPVIQAQHTRMNRVTLYKAAPFACCIAWVVWMFVGADKINNITGNSPRDIILFLLNPFVKGCAVITLLSGCMQNRRIETATLLVFILFCKEVHQHSQDSEMMKSLVVGLAFSSISLAVCIMKHVPLVSESLTRMAAYRV